MKKIPETTDSPDDTNKNNLRNLWLLLKTIKKEMS